MTFKKLFCLFLSLCLVFPIFSLPIFASDSEDILPISSSVSLELDCESAILMEANTGSVLYEKNPDIALPPASVTKIMTLLLVMEAIDSGALSYSDTVTASAHASSMGGSQIFLKEGEQMTVEDMLKSVVIASANDAAVALAEHIAGSESAFVAKMNARAAELGMQNTHFENTNGLDDTAENHVTSARDIAIMSRELISHKDILKFSSTWMDTVRNGEFGLTNTNRLVRYYNGCTGLKTGSTSKAKFCISATAERDGMSLIAVIMASPSRDARNNAAKQLLDYGFSNYELFSPEIELPESVKAVGSAKESCKIEMQDFVCTLPRGKAKNVKAELTLDEKIKAPVDEGDCVGYVKFTLDGKEIGKAEIVAAESAERITYLQVFKKIISFFLLKK